MSASTRRKKVKPVANGLITFKLVIDAQEMVVDYRRSPSSGCMRNRQTRRER